MSVIVVTAPETPNFGPEIRGYPSVFLAGGITGCPHWQAEAITLFEKTGIDVILLNPRRDAFPIEDPSAAEEQIRWEWERLRQVHAVMFWFCAETIQPITLFELGSWLHEDGPVFVGAHPDYPRRQDILIQTRLQRPNLQPVADNLEDLVDQVVGWFGTR